MSDASGDAALAADWPEVARDRLVSCAGVAYRDFRRDLRPRYGLVWAQIAAAWGALGLLAATLVRLEAASPLFAWLGVPFFALGFGYALAFLFLFLHEAGHYNLARDRVWNDRLANLFIGLLTGYDVRQYRPVHFEHHRKLGTPLDTEHTYFEHPDARFIGESLTGIRVLRVLLGRRARLAQAAGAGARTLNAQAVGALALHAAILVGLALVGSWPLALAWIIGAGSVFPFLASFRQLLEHRSFEARADVDYAQVPHGAVARLFGDGPIASTFGGAGFNRHLLHHWDPQVSCTRLPDLERYLAQTDAADWLQAHRTTYWEAARRLMAR